jgi:WD40 repeat protein
MALVGNDKVAVVGWEDEISCWGLDGDRRWMGILGFAPSPWVEGTCVAASPDGTKVVAGSDIGGRVEAWSASGGYEGNVAPVQHGGYFSDKHPAAVAIADNGDVAVARVCGIVDICRNGQIAHRRKEGRPRGIVIGSSGHVVSCGSFGINIQARDGELQRYTSAFNAVNVAVSPDSEHIAAATGNQVRIFSFGDPSAGPVHILTVDSGSVTRVAYCPVGGYLAVGTSSGAVCVWAADRSKAGTFASTDDICGLAFARNGDRLVAASTDGRVRWWDLS